MSADVGRRPSTQTSIVHQKPCLRGVLYHSTVVNGVDKLQLVLPAKFRETALRGLHDDTGHMGRDRTWTLLRDRFYWPSMAKRVEEWIKTCDRWMGRKGQTNIKAPLVNITTSQPLEILCLDFLTLETSKGVWEIAATCENCRLSLVSIMRSSTSWKIQKSYRILKNMKTLRRRVHTWFE